MRQAALDDVHQQTFIGFGAAFFRRLLQVQAQMHRVHLHARAGLFHHHRQLNGLFGLQRNDQPIGLAHFAFAKHRERLIGKLNDDF